MGITELIIHSVTSFISFGGYPSLAVLMVLESMVVPLPSEAVMPFAGFLISEARFTFVGVILASTLGSLVGSLISYYIGEYGGNAVLKKWGKYIFLNQEHLLKTEQFFARRGNMTVFIGRFIPIIRHFISIPAGIARMNKAKFLLYTALGAGLWNAFLAWVGLVLKQNWGELKKYSEVLDVLVIGVIVIGVFFLFLKKRKKKSA